MNIDSAMSDDEKYFQFNKLAQGNINTQLILLSVKLKLPELLADGTKTLAQLSDLSQCHQPTLARFLRGMCTLDLVREIEPQLYDKGGLLDLVYSVNGPGFGQTAYQVWEQSLHSVKTGEPAWEQVFGQSFYEYLDNNPSQSHLFDQWNDNSAFFMDLLIGQYDFSPCTTLIDLGGGQGAFLTKLLKQYPSLHGTIFDREEVIQNTNQTLSQAALEPAIATRLNTQSGSFFDNIPANADAYTICRVLLNWNDQQVIDILKNCCAAMSNSSKLIIVDFYIPTADDPAFDHMVTHDLNLLVNFGGGLRTTDQWCSLIEAAGLSISNTLTAQSSPLFLMETIRND